jgi:hypothetical protein
MAELSFQTKLKKSLIILIIVFLVAVYGGAIEYLQQNYFINRSGDYMDLAADILGGIVAILLYPWIKNKRTC